METPVDGTTEPPDVTAPSTVNDLILSTVAPTSVTLRWTAGGDDADLGTESQYDVRYSTTGPIVTVSDFNAATPVSGEPAPALSGSTETFTLTGLQMKTRYWFALRVAA